MKLIRHLALAGVLLAASFPLAAQSHKVHVEFWGTWLGVPGEHKFEGLDRIGDAELDFGTAGGVGLGVNMFLSRRWAGDLSVSTAQPDAIVRIRTLEDVVSTVDLGKTRVTPLTAVLQYHFNPEGKLDVYLGAGAAFVFVTRSNTDFQSNGGVFVDSFDFGNNPGLALDGGFCYHLGEHWGLNGDVKFIPMRSSATATFARDGSAEGTINLAPLIASAGLSYRF